MRVRPGRGMARGSRTPDRRARSLAAAALFGLLGSLAQPVLFAATNLDDLFASYRSGDHDVVARTLRQSLDFQGLRLAEGRRLDRWLGPWQRDKAVLLLEMANASSQFAPAYTVPLLSAGQRYLARRPATAGVRAADDEFERLWHRAALAILERGFSFNATRKYVSTLTFPVRAGSPGIPALDARVVLAAAVAEEQDCWTQHPDSVRFGSISALVIRAASDRKTRQDAAIDWTASTDFSPSGAAEYRRCLQATLERFEVAERYDETRDEARVRRAWTLFQLGRVDDALASIDGVGPGDDRALSYWATLFRGRIADALGRDDDAERAYRAALDVYPSAQSAGVGLAVKLFTLNRLEEAEAVAAAVRGRSDSAVDPWLTYIQADGRFLDCWISQLRKAIP